jgi:hypothetical protein
MPNAGLDLRAGKGRLDGLGEALEAVDHGDEDVLNTAVFEIIQDLGPELRPLIGLEPQAQNVPCAVRQDRQSLEDRLVRHSPVASDIDPDRVHEHHRIAGLQRAVLPGGDVLRLQTVPRTV